MKILMTHEITDEMLKLDLADFDMITFDDGLYSQYKNYKHFLKFNKPLYFFISTNIVCEENEIQNEEVLSCSLSHKLFFENNDKRNYMKWSQIKELYITENCYIGGHSHNHKKLIGLPLKEQVNFICYDVIDMMTEFKKQNIEISSFCFPYNDELFAYSHYLKKIGIKNFFGKDRISIEKLI